MKRSSMLVIIAFLGSLLSLSSPVQAQSLNPDPPPEPVKLIFIHHSVGENWLTDGNGNLGRVLGENNYFVSDTNYGWGPDSIGDATDYHNWYDWFLGSESPRYLEALYNENGQNSSYTRLISDPGGPNQIIIFKSCFPNSDLSGYPNDSPSDGEWFTVSHAKYVYNQLLTYFESRPDKLFVAITMPPLLDTSNAENAREFSRWLVEDWLVENDYPYNNVAVWDLHNTLTHPDNHHRFIDGGIDHSIENGNGTLYYDSGGDEHPNGIGNQKATNEFVPMLNIFYNRWIANAPPAPLPDDETEVQLEGGETSPEEDLPPQELPSTVTSAGIIDDFESGNPAGTNRWEAFWDESVPTTLSCGVDSSVSQSGSASLRMDVYIEPDSWATCALLADESLETGNAQGISFDYRASNAGLIFDFDAHSGPPDARATYFHAIETSPDSVNGWTHIELTWDQIVRVDWEENPGSPVNPAEINGFAFGFGSLNGAPNSGTIWIDNLALITTDSHPSESQTERQVGESNPQEEAVPAENETTPIQERSDGRRLCPSSVGMIGVVGLLGIVVNRKRR